MVELGSVHNGRLTQPSSGVSPVDGPLLETPGQRQSRAAFPRRSRFASGYLTDGLRSERFNLTRAWESISYVSEDNELLREELRQSTEATRFQQQRWRMVIIVVIGVCTGFVTVGLLLGIESANRVKMEWVMSLYSTSSWNAWLALTMTNMALFTASCSVILFVHPPAAGSGVPEVKAYLNGILLKQSFSSRTFVCKFLSTSLACGSGLPVGPEGPIIALGGCLGHLFSSDSVLNLLPGGHLRFTNQFRRTAISLGVSAGVAAAFGAPIGAVLFTIEEVAQLFNNSILWVGFVSSFMSYLVTILFNWSKAIVFSEASEGGFRTGGLFNVGDVNQWKLQEIPCFVVLGVCMGLFGALFNFCNVHIVNTLYRKTVVRVNRRRQLLEVAVLAGVVSTVLFVVPYFWACIPKGNLRKDVSGEASDLLLREFEEGFNSIWCDNRADEYNPMGTLTLATLDEQVRFLFLSSHTGTDFAPFSTNVLLCYFLLFSASACLLAGTVMSTGVFIPMIIMGGAFGRTYGRVLQYLLPHFVEEGFDYAAYAVVGAAACVAGCTHITIAITVIMLEITSDFRLLGPIMVAVSFSRGVADMFTPSLYDMILEAKLVPFLAPEPSVLMERLRCCQVMSKPVQSFPLAPTVKDVLEKLRDPALTHNGFPVVHNKSLVGTVTRHQLDVLLTNLEWFLTAPLDSVGVGQALDGPMGQLASYRNSPVSLGWEQSVHDVPDHLLAERLDLSRWMDAAPLTIHTMHSVSRAYLLFKNFGLRHLPVVDEANSLQGMITRHDIAHIQNHPEKYEGSMLRPLQWSFPVAAAESTEPARGPDHDAPPSRGARGSLPSVGRHLAASIRLGDERNGRLLPRFWTPDEAPDEAGDGVALSDRAVSVRRVSGLFGNFPSV